MRQTLMTIKLSSNSLREREDKRPLKLRQAKAKDQALREKAHDLKASTGATDKQLSKRF
jgi:hypothetical protein